MRCVPILMALGLGVGPGCAHAPPKGYWDAAARRVCAGDVCYRVGDLGPGWRLVHLESAALGFYSDRLGAVVESNATCRDDGDAAPLEALTRQLLIGYTERRMESQETLPFAGREALRTRATAKLDGVPMRLDVYVLKRNGCVFDLSYAAPARVGDAGGGDFARFVGGFADLRRPREGNG